MANAKGGGADKKSSANESKLIAVLRSQVLTLTRENDELREKLQVCINVMGCHLGTALFN